jgi:hypothetical protein
MGIRNYIDKMKTIILLFIVGFLGGWFLWDILNHRNDKGNAA